jgi:hypothetical protein
VQAYYDARFEREMGCTVREWLDWLPGAVAPHALRVADGAADVTIGDGALRLAWQLLSPRRIALITLPRLHVRFVFDGVADDARQRFMRRFDLYTQRGGG